MLDVRRNSLGYYVVCEECRHRQEVTRDDVEDDVVECEHCGHFIGDPEDDDSTDRQMAEEDN